jgi:hypothetical protein
MEVNNLLKRKKWITLAKSKYFKPEDITFHCNFFNFFIHQYLKVRVANNLIFADPAGASIRGELLGGHINFFG